MLVRSGFIQVLKARKVMELCNFPFKTLKDMELESGSYVVIEEDLMHYFLEQSKTRNIWIERLFSCYF